MHYKTYSKISIIFLLIIVLISLSSSNIHARQKYGIRLGVYSDIDGTYVGAERLFHLSPDFWLTPNFEYVFADNITFFSINMDITYDFTPTRNFVYWIGAGPGLVYSNPEGSEEGGADFGANILAGIRIRTKGPVTPYLQAKILLSDYQDFVFGFGLRF